MTFPEKVVYYSLGVFGKWYPLKQCFWQKQMLVHVIITEYYPNGFHSDFYW
jgi:hypothetical protein